jgi:hypothetical protein
MDGFVEFFSLGQFIDKNLVHVKILECCRCGQGVEISVVHRIGIIASQEMDIIFLCHP